VDYAAVIAWDEKKREISREQTQIELHFLCVALNCTVKGAVETLPETNTECP
jgi:hypothetical protein